jgi:heme oxygenase (biliverdin-IX-beta and delta-forming)
MLQPVDEEARRLAKSLLRKARYAALAVLDPSDGSPSVSRTIVATTMEGRLVFLISSLSPHFAALEADPRASLLVGKPGKGDPLAHARMTLVGRATRMADQEARRSIRHRFLGRHPKSELYVDFADFAFWRFDPKRISMNGGFGKAFELQPSDVLTNLDGINDLIDMEEGAVAHMNEDHKDAIDKYARSVGQRDTGWKLASLDPEGLDLVRTDTAERVWFGKPLTSASELRPTLVDLARRRED